MVLVYVPVCFAVNMCVITFLRLGKNYHSWVEDWALNPLISKLISFTHCYFSLSPQYKPYNINNTNKVIDLNVHILHPVHRMDQAGGGWRLQLPACGLPRIRLPPRQHQHTNRQDNSKSTNLKIYKGMPLSAIEWSSVLKTTKER